MSKNRDEKCQYIFVHEVGKDDQGNAHERIRSHHRLTLTRSTEGIERYSEECNHFLHTHTDTHTDALIIVHDSHCVGPSVSVWSP